MRELLEAVADGSLSPAQAEAELNGYVTGDAGRFDAARDQRRGVPEAIFAEGKSADQIVALAETALETTDRALLTRISPPQFEALESYVDETIPDATIERRETTVRVMAPDYEPPSIDAAVGIATGGTVDGPVAAEAEAVCLDAGVTIDRVDDIGVAALSRTLDQLERLRDADVLIVAAGREGALPTVVAGLVDTPVIGVPISSGYGYAGDGEGALAGMLQSCTVLSVVNIDAGFVAGAQAVLIARTIAAARD
ncbi:nickel pincer cofactor biosynthesis protein LarB [Natrinema halophilum]|uniref:Nickel pincer cofactor biosynthesis protein LarB n=1 Tax=Natrinema halophilum TaxID=1699371 RepID=A0A7D5H3D4_9EURY|nr:nickel pincer cofactor biosynthesis protein LarB [Natrinema halophilum]QLG49751.1 nickel pincer cofactor biosynthesis protein LarB [Natrinema halophilum]